ncbi:hypothetical protein HELRODRAFT_169483 [Helobdella robusta]|uniref:Uncharacterized protein n=1 Tax=Helobdella robusta TaxID=6412 RepID=T1F200_HELRO|nr:hypothetical protein HELRODRAFT_169483 [Helobdella robusta]ESO08604.1 hypothetical protein HELRODRAFT_169483 [Helobdella robusta]
MASLTLCHLCYKHYKLRQDGTFVRHGGKVKGSECPESMKHRPLTRKRRSFNVGNANMSTTSVDARVFNTAVDLESKSSLGEHFFEKSFGCHLIDHIPKQYRGKFGRMLNDNWKNICDNPSDDSRWFRLPCISSLVLRKELHGGGQHNISAKINSRVDTFVRDSNEELIEQGNVINAMRTLASKDTMAPDSADILNSPKVEHPSTPLDKKSSPIKKSISVTVNPQPIMLCLRQFPKGTSGGRDGLTPQHLRDLTHDKLETTDLINEMICFINLQLSGTADFKNSKYKDVNNNTKVFVPICVETFSPVDKQTRLFFIT